MTRFHSIGGNEVEAHYAGGELAQTIDSKARPDANLPSLLAGAARSLTGDEPTEATFLDRACPGTTGQATVQSVRGSTIVQDGSLLPVRMEGIETVGFNQWDEQWEVGSISNVDGNNSSSSTTIRSKNYIPVFPNTTYCTHTGGPAIVVFFYDADKSFISSSIVYSPYTVTTPANAHYMRFRMSSDYGVTYKDDICINLSWSGRRNGEYESYWSAQREIAASTYFPDGMRSAGSVRDELTETQAITRVGSVDLGTLTWTKIDSAETPFFNGVPPADIDAGYSIQSVNLKCSAYEWAPVGSTGDASGICISSNRGGIRIRDTRYTDAATFKSAMSGVMLHYALATPTTTPIDPPLNMTYRAEQGGTERITHAQQSAPPVLSIAYGHTAEGIVQEAASAIAAQDGPTATANHSVGGYLTMGGTLYRVTTAIATGEAIVPGTNVTATTVMAEVLSLIQ